MATSCPICGEAAEPGDRSTHIRMVHAAVTEWTDSAPGADAKRPSRTMVAWVATSLLVVGALLLMWALNIGKGPATSDRSHREEGDVWEACRGAVDRELVAPSTAQFPEFASDAVVLDGEASPLGTSAPVRTYEVRSYVDSENAFGALVRTDFRCQVRVDSDGAGVTGTDLDPRDDDPNTGPVA